MNRLFIAEKPSLARAIIEVLPMPHTKRENYVECGEGNVVAWCAGHILELSPPDVYSAEYEKWTLQHLPIIPDKWQRRESIPELFNTLKNLLSQAKTVVHAGDPDREGQLLVDEVLQQVNYSGTVLRLLINDMNPVSVKKALDSLQSNEQFKGMSQAAEARGKADWLYGLNMTRLYTLLGRSGGYQGVLSVGRVQTPLLGLIVRRDLEIEQFTPTPYYRLVVNFHSDKGDFTALWQPAEEWTDDENRLIEKAKAIEVQQAILDKMGSITGCERRKKSESAPLPYSLADLQVDAGKKLALSAKETLDICQRLYETHKLTTYPRSDCAYLPQEHLNQLDTVMLAIKNNLSDLSSLTDNADKTLRSRAWDDKKISAHHAIIPTTTQINGSALSESERAVYVLIAKRYLAQFYPAMEYTQTVLEVTVSEEIFKASGKQVLAVGWKVLYATDISEEETENNEADEAEGLLPAVDKGDSAKVLNATTEEKKTQPPQRFTDATLIKAMTNIAKFVSDPNIKRILKETDGIGTPATQAHIIQVLFDRAYVEKKGKSIISTPTGRALIAILPDIATLPDMTAKWENDMRLMVDREVTLEAFLMDMTIQLSGLIESGKATGRLVIPGVDIHACPACNSALRRHESTKQPNRFYWFCQNEACTQILEDENGQPKAKLIFPCTGSDCKGSLSRREGKTGGYWWGCSEYKNGCRVTAEDANGKPVEKVTRPCTNQNCQGSLLRRPSKKGGFWWGCSEFKNGCKITMDDLKGEPVPARNRAAMS